MKKRTDELLEILKKKTDIDSFIEEHEDEFENKSLSQLLNEILCDCGIEKAEVVRRSNLDKTYAYQMFSGIKSNPSRDKIIMLCIAMNATLKDVQTLLQKAEYPSLYPRKRRDSALIFAFEQHLSLIETNELLYDIKEDILE